MQIRVRRPLRFLSGDGVFLEFRLNSFQFKQFFVGDRGRVVFRNCCRYHLAEASRLGAVVRHFIVLLCFAAAFFSSRVSWSQACEPTAPTRAVLEQLEVPDDAHLPAVQRRELKLELMRKALSAAPADTALHEAYQRVRLDGMEVNRPDLIIEYEQLLAKHPNDSGFLYLAAEVQMGRKTKEAIANLERAIGLAPSFGLPHLLLAQIYFAHAYENTAEADRHLERFAELCPSSVRALPTLRWSKDKELIRREAARLRKNVEARTDSDAVAAYPTLWSFEVALERSDQQSENQARMRRDIDRLFTPEFTRNSAWLATIEATGFFEGVPDRVSRKAQQEVAALYPNSDAAAREEFNKTAGDAQYPTKGTPEQVASYWRQTWHSILPLVRKWPATLWLADTAARAVAQDPSATSNEVAGVIALFQKAFQLDPDGFRTLPPAPISIAQQLVDRDGPFESIPDMVLGGFASTDRWFGANAANDISGVSSDALSERRNTFYLMGYLPLAESYVYLGQLSNANDALVQADLRLRAIRPPDNASSAERFRFDELAAAYWRVRGLYSEKSGHKVDALVDYRNALSLFPPRRPRPDRRDEVMVSAQRLWKDLGGTAQGWDDWANRSSLASFYAGGEGSQAWSKLADLHPDLVLTDALGNRWNPRDLAKRTTFITMWASWCGPCRAELPYFEKLYEHFQGRNDIAILALNVDDDPKAMTTALQELKVSIPSIAARDFAYSIVPEMALPANWIISPGKTEMFAGNDSSHEAWLKSAVTAIEKAAGK
jgi:tetratricopeptide (TPR) repeat protein